MLVKLAPRETRIYNEILIFSIIKWCKLTFKQNFSHKSHREDEALMTLNFTNVINNKCL
jgi:hypothetical protein